MKKIIFSLSIAIVIGGIYVYTKVGNQHIPTNLQISPEISSYNTQIPSLEVENNEQGEEYIIINDEEIHKFKQFDSALKFAKINGYNEIYFQDKDTLIWKEDIVLKDRIILKVPHLLQYPELARGCEVTSLAMILNYYGYQVDKMELAEKVKKDNTPYLVDEEGKIHYGNPYDGFVGNIYSVKEMGYGVYHEPIADLAKEYVNQKVIDITGSEFKDVLSFVSRGNPIWIVTNATFKALEESSFDIWHTPTGIVKITKRMHSVVITGYDKEYVYVNDPLHSMANRKINKKEFQDAWEQMGNQAIVILE